MINIDLIKEKNIYDDKLISYNELKEKYKQAFEIYISKKVDLYSYDDDLETSVLDFSKVNFKTKTKKQLRSYLGLNYLYIINDFFIEKLSISDLNVLKKIDNTNFIFNEEIYNLVEKTYKDIIKDNYFNNVYTNKRYKVCYGENIKSNYAYNDSLVIKIIYSINKKNYTKEQFLKNITNKKFFLKILTENLEINIKDKLGIDTHFLIEKTTEL